MVAKCKLFPRTTQWRLIKGVGGGGGGGGGGREVVNNDLSDLHLAIQVVQFLEDWTIKC